MIKVYHAATGTTKTIAFPSEAGDVVALRAEKDSEDDSLIIIEAGDDFGNSKGFYVVDSYSGDISLMNEGEEVIDEGDEAPVENYQQEAKEEKQQPAAKKQTPNTRKRQTYDDDDEYEYRHDRSSRRPHDWQGRHHRQGDNPPPPRYNHQDEGGTDFHLEPVGGSQGSNQGTGVHLQKIDRIPNRR